MPNKRAIFILLITSIGMVIPFGSTEAVEAKAPERSRGANTAEYKAEGLRDPFQGEKIEIKEPEAPGETKPLPALKVQGIVWGGNSPQAIINNKVVGVGDTIEGVRITGINNSVVTVSFGNRPYNLSTISAISPKGSKNSSESPKKNP